MCTYKVLKDFPSKNGVRQYKAGQLACFSPNSRTKGLVEMGFLQAIETSEDLDTQITQAVLGIDGIVGVKVVPCADNCRMYSVLVRTE